MMSGAVVLALVAPAPGFAQEAVVLLHGLARSSDSMGDLEAVLQAEGYRVRNVDYPSTGNSFEVLVDRIAAEIEKCCLGAERLHFVTHSLGGLLTRGYLARGHPKNLGRVVMIAPPNQGSEIVDELGNLELFRAFFGPTGSALGTDPGSVPLRLGLPDFEFGVIAGSERLNPVGWLLIPGESDGAVSIENTRLEGMSDFIVVPENHTFIAQSRPVAQEVVHFLRAGRFSPAAQRWKENERTE